MPALALAEVDHSFGSIAALTGVNLEIAPGEILGVTGPSGAGKSTLCRVIAGVQAPGRGDVLIDRVPVTSVPPERRRIAVMFESYALYPHLTVFDNVAFPLRAPGAPRRSREELDARVHGMLRFVEIGALASRRPGELSGGQRQRVALSRALVQDARAYVLDEPISHLDAKLRHTLRGAVRRRLIGGDAPTVWTSPDALEVLAVADRVAVLVGGRIRQVGAPTDVYRWPADVDVARLVGDPPLNLLATEIVSSGDGLRLQHAAFSVELPAHARQALEASSDRSRVILGLRPAEIAVTRDGRGAVAGRVWVWEPVGRYGILSVRLGEEIVKLKVPRTERFQPGDPVTLDLRRAEPLLFDSGHGAALRVRTL